MWWEALLWLPGCVVFGGAVGWVAAMVAQRTAPLVVFPLLVGSLLGVSLVGSMRLLGVGHRCVALAAAILAPGAAVWAQHYTAYHAARHAAQCDLEMFQRAEGLLGNLVQGHAPVGPEGLFDFLGREARRGRTLSTVAGDWIVRGWQAWASWAVDGLLVLLPAVGITIVALGRPFCRACHSWYHTIRSGTLSAPAAGEVAGLLGIEKPSEPAAADYRLLACPSGCGPTGVRLRWEGRRRDRDAETIWLDPQRRDALVALLDAERSAFRNDTT